MKDIKLYITEEADNQSKMGKKIDAILSKNPNKLSKIIQSRQEHWDANTTDYAREPMFLVADAKSKDFENISKNRDYSWVRWRYMKDSRHDINGTFRNYNMSDKDGNKPNSVIGIYYDRHFEMITSLEVFNKLCDLFEKEYSKYYNNLYETKDED